MRVLSLAAAAALFLVGCNKSPEGGTPGTDKSFTLSGPTTTTNIKQDNKESVTISVKRGKEFKQNVKLSATSPSDKVKVDFSKDTVTPADPNDVSLNITVAKDAPLGAHTIRVTGTPDTGTATSLEVKISVDKNP